MLVLSRGKSEKIVIGEGIVIEVVEIDGKRVKLAITAPREILVLRQELLRKGQANGDQPTQV